MPTAGPRFCSDQRARGSSDVERHRADALAELGYVALAFDLHGGRYLGDPEEMLARCMPLLADPDRMRDIGHAALMALNDLGRSCSPKFPTWWRWSG